MEEPISQLSSKARSLKRILCLDMNSYFASAEQQDHPHLRGKPIAVTGEGKRTIVIAASREAKVYGVSTAMKLYEAKRLCPHIIFVPGDGDKYASVQKKILHILQRYFLSIEIASIDEVFIDATGVGDWDALYHIATQIKADFRKYLGDYLTCSIGISFNKRMAKLGSNLKKPDGLTIVDETKVANILPNLPIEEISGIGRSLTKRLHMLGVYTCGELARFPVPVLRQAFGPHASQFLHNISIGIDDSPVVATQEEPKSFGHDITLPHDIFSFTTCYRILYALTEKAVFRMKKHDMQARGIGVYVRYGDFSGEYVSKLIPTYTDSPFLLFSHIKKQFLTLADRTRPIRQVGIRLYHVQPKSNLPATLFPDKSNALYDIAFKINEKYGYRTIAPLSTYHAKHTDRKIHGFYKQH